MCVGEKREVIIPANYGWDEPPRAKVMSGRGKPLPLGADIKLEIELLRFADAPTKNTNFFKEMDLDNDDRVSKEEMERWFKERHPRKIGTTPNGLWDRQDKDKDGLISWEEFDGPKGEAHRGREL